MSRWAPDARGRLQYSALELFAEQGFDSTTVVEITERAGLTERTFYRHFADKREVLFAGSLDLRDFLVACVENDVLSANPAAVIINALCASATAFFEERRDAVQIRQRIIDANEDLQERELIKLASLCVSLADALRRRGVEDRTSRLSAESGITVFRVAFEDWVRSDTVATLSQCIRACASELSDLAANGSHRRGDVAAAAMSPRESGRHSADAPEPRAATKGR